MTTADGGRAGGARRRARPRQRTQTPGATAAIATLGLAVLAACGGGASGPAPAPAPAPTPTPTPVPATPPTTAPATPPSAPRSAPAVRAGTRFAYAPGAHRYEVRTETTVELAGTAERETVTRLAHVSYGVAPEGRTTAVAGQVDSMTLRTSARVGDGATETRLAAPVRFRGTFDPPARAGQAPPAAELAPAAATPRCASREAGLHASALAAARETVVRVPAAIPDGARWRDSTTIATCSGEVPVTVTTVARYEVTERVTVDGIPAVRARRETTITIRGQGYARGQPVTVAGTGTGLGSVLLDPAAGRLLGADDDAQTRLRIAVGKGAAREFAQRVRTGVTVVR